VLHYHPIAFGDGFYVRANRYNFEAPFIAANSARVGGTEERGERRLDGIDALYLIYVCWVDWGCKCAEEEGARGE
jgi:hypothetical protein